MYALRLIAIAAIAASAGVSQAATLSGVTGVGAGNGFSCAVTSTGATRCWGNPMGTLNARSAATAVLGASGGMAAIAAGGEHACALTSAGGVKCWGHNYAGQLGTGTTVESDNPVDVVGLTSGVAAIEAGYEHTCALTTGGAVKCWGSNAFGQLGDGSVTRRLTPVDVTGMSSGVASITGGFFHTCAVTGGALKCWGSNDRGQLGDGTRVNRLTPIDVPGLASGVTAASGGSQITCAVVSGGVKCWGRADLAQMGTGASTPMSPDQLAPAPVLNLSSGVSAVSAGGTFACALTTAGGVKCWGTAFNGAIGDGNTITIANTPLDVVGLGSGVVAISAGSSHNVALMGDGTVRYWGYSHTRSTSFPEGGPLGIVSFPTPQVVVYLAPQTITFAPIASRDLAATPFSVTATSTSGLPVTTRMVSSFPVCDVTGNTVNLMAIGMCSIRAEQGGDNTDYNTALPVTRSFRVTGSPVGAAPRLGNISTRGPVLTEHDVLIAGFIITGTVSKTVVVTAAGPSLASSGVVNPLANPTLTLVRQSNNTVVATNDDWQTATNAALIEASGVAPTNPLESAIMATLLPGAYTAIVRGVGASTGIGLVGAFEIDRPEAPLINVATRGQVLTGEGAMIAGFIIHGTDPKTVVVNVAGPSLANFGVPGPLADPTLTLVRSSDQSILATNDNWQAAANAAQIQASGFAPANPSEPAIMMTLPPGAYTAIVRGAGSTTGIGLVGVFAVP